MTLPPASSSSLPSVATESRAGCFTRQLVLGLNSSRQPSLSPFPPSPHGLRCFPLGSLSQQIHCSLISIRHGGCTCITDAGLGPRWTHFHPPLSPCKTKTLQGYQNSTHLPQGLQHAFLNFCASKLVFSSTVSPYFSVIYDCVGNALLLNHPDFWL